MSETPPKNVKVTKQPNWKSKDSKPTGQHGKSKGSHKTHQLGEVDLEQDVEDNTYGMYSLCEPSFKGNHPYEITVNVDGKPQVMELNTGAAVSVIGETQFREQFPEKELQDSCKYMQTYSGERVKITGFI